MIEKYDIAGYCRISVDDELNKKSVSIENQKAIIEDYVKVHFPGSSLTFFEDRDKSGYTFAQREGYQEMRQGLMNHKYDILIIKDFSRFSRRNGRGLVELEDLRDAGVRIISIGDNVDFPNDDEWVRIQLHFFMNEMPVTDASRKVKAVVQRRQEEGKWLCAAPYGYILVNKDHFEVVPEEADIVRLIFTLYIEDGWGYKRIAEHLTDQGVPTPRMAEKQRKEAIGKSYNREVKPVWSIATIQGILANDFYIGTLRQSKYTRTKINGTDIKKNVEEHIILENHHQPIIDYRTFATAKALLKERSTSHYRGVKKYDNVYSGFLECGDCGSPMFAMSRADLHPAYRCGTYHRRGLKACTSHHIRVETLDELLKDYVQMIKANSSAMLERLNADLAREEEDVSETEQAAGNLSDVLEDLREELKATKRQRIRDNMKHPENEELNNETYDEMEAELAERIQGIENQLSLTVDKRNTIIRVNRAAKTAMEVFDDILAKPALDRNDLQLIIQRIKVFEDRIEIQLKADIESLLQCGSIPEEDGEDAANFEPGTERSVTAVQVSDKHRDRVFRANVISDGDPLEIYTEKDGEVIFKKYSPMGEMSDFAAQICESMHKTAEFSAAVCDRDGVIAAAGSGRKEIIDRHISPELAGVMEGRRAYRAESGQHLPVTEQESSPGAVIAVPILAEGDVLGCVLFLERSDGRRPGETELKLATTVAGFLGRQMET